LVVYIAVSMMHDHTNIKWTNMAHSQCTSN